jgi:two-component system, OmpR family, phosphate regulon sensor histidine kinase PhoR
MAFSMTERKVAGADTSRGVLRGILDASREAILVVDASTRITAANAAAHEAFARGPIALPERRLAEIIRDHALHEGFQQTLNETRPIDIRIELVGFEKRTFDVHIAPILLEGLGHAIAVFYDMTQIERLERVRQEFLSNISHELRTPLTSILAYVETLEDGAIDDPENNRRFVSVIRRNAERMNGLIADISELSLIETGNISIEVKDVPLGRTVDDIFAALSAKAAARGIGLASEVEPQASVRADPIRLEQMLTNLIDNAIKFNRENGDVKVSLTVSDDKSFISVMDTGEGIVPENLQRIFERFYRIDRGRTRNVGGTGLGLAIVKHLARLHGGDVLVASTLGRGTTFSIELPQ